MYSVDVMRAITADSPTAFKTALGDTPVDNHLLEQIIQNDAVKVYITAVYMLGADETAGVKELCVRAGAKKILLYTERCEKSGNPMWDLLGYILMFDVSKLTKSDMEVLSTRDTKFVSRAMQLMIKNDSWITLHKYIHYGFMRATAVKEYIEMCVLANSYDCFQQLLHYYHFDVDIDLCSDIRWVRLALQIGVKPTALCLYRLCSGWYKVNERDPPTCDFNEHAGNVNVCLRIIHREIYISAIIGSVARTKWYEKIWHEHSTQCVGSCKCIKTLRKIVGSYPLQAKMFYHYYIKCCHNDVKYDGDVPYDHDALDSKYVTSVLKCCVKDGNQVAFDAVLRKYKDFGAEKVAVCCINHNWSLGWCDIRAADTSEGINMVEMARLAVRRDATIALQSINIQDKNDLAYIAGIASHDAVMYNIVKSAGIDYEAYITEALRVDNMKLLHDGIRSYISTRPWETSNDVPPMMLAARGRMDVVDMIKILNEGIAESVPSARYLANLFEQ